MGVFENMKYLYAKIYANCFHVCLVGRLVFWHENINHNQNNNYLERYFSFQEKKKKGLKYSQYSYHCLLAHPVIRTGHILFFFWCSKVMFSYKAAHLQQSRDSVSCSRALKKGCYSPDLPGEGRFISHFKVPGTDVQSPAAAEQSGEGHLGDSYHRL